jgi:hypothetical protein
LSRLAELLPEERFAAFTDSLWELSLLDPELATSVSGCLRNADGAAQ